MLYPVELWAQYSTNYHKVTSKINFADERALVSEMSPIMEACFPEYQSLLSDQRPLSPVSNSVREKHMKTIWIIALLCLVLCSLQAQVPVKKDLMQILEKVPPPPAHSREASAKLTFEENSGTFSCSTAKLFESIDVALKDVEDAYTAQAKSGNAQLPPGVSPDMAKQMQDPEMKKKMKGMTKEEKMKMAMEMMGSAPAGVPVQVADPPLVQAALTEWQKESA
jgi:hypothetical protein